MIEKIKKNGTKYKWIGFSPVEEKKLAVIIPQYNELSNNTEFLQRLDYFNSFSKRHEAQLDVILVDDGSTDESLQVIKDYARTNAVKFYIASVYPNAKKVGAIYLTVAAIKNPYVILSDFDTDIVGLDSNISGTLELLNDKSLMGGYFRMLPFEGAGAVFLHQQLEYSILRGLYRFHKPEKSIAVMPGAGSLYDKSVLISIYGAHSGLLSGEDREATLLGLKLGYKAEYLENITALTRPPRCYRTLIKQRIRWNLGYIETFDKENKFYLSQLGKQSKIGIRFIMDLVWVFVVISLPLITLTFAFFDWRLLIKIYTGLYLFGISWCLLFFLTNPAESTEFKRHRLISVVIFPLSKVYIDYLSWTGAFIRFYKNKNEKA